jgi:hypothetical protein
MDFKMRVMRIYTLCIMMLCIGVYAADQEEQQVAEQEQKPSWDGASQDDDGVTTTQDLRGNWYSKRKILNDSRRVFESMRSIIDELEEGYGAYLSKRNDVVSTVDTFYLDYAFKGGAIDSAMNDISEQLKQERSDEGELTEEERAYVGKLESYQNELEQLQVDMQSLHELHIALDQSLRTLHEQIDKARDFEEKTWEYYNAISQVLSDKIATQMYYEMQGLSENVKKISDYMTGDVDAFLNNTIGLINEYVEKTKTDIDALEKEGIVLRENVAAEVVDEEVQEDEQAPSPEQAKEEAAPGWFQRALTNVKMAWQGFVSWIASWFIVDSSSQPKKSIKVDTEDTASTPALGEQAQQTVNTQTAEPDLENVEQAQPEAAGESQGVAAAAEETQQEADVPDAKKAEPDLEDIEQEQPGADEDASRMPAAENAQNVTDNQSMDPEFGDVEQAQPGAAEDTARVAAVGEDAQQAANVSANAEEVQKTEQK